MDAFRLSTPRAHDARQCETKGVALVPTLLEKTKTSSLLDFPLLVEAARKGWDLEATGSA